MFEWQHYVHSILQSISIVRIGGTLDSVILRSCTVVGTMRFRTRTLDGFEQRLCCLDEFQTRHKILHLKSQPRDVRLNNDQGFVSQTSLFLKSQLSITLRGRFFRLILILLLLRFLLHGSSDFHLIQIRCVGRTSTDFCEHIDRILISLGGIRGHVVLSCTSHENISQRKRIESVRIVLDKIRVQIDQIRFLTTGSVLTERQKCLRELMPQPAFRFFFVFEFVVVMDVR